MRKHQWKGAPEAWEGRKVEWTWGPLITPLNTPPWLWAPEGQGKRLEQMWGGLSPART